ncbi:MAG: VOC family protein [Myxococcales bacterium]|nr:VOC family protein [Myxococcales bacterium]
MFDHVSLGVRDLGRAAAFYDAVLGALGHVRLFENARCVAYGPPGFAGEFPFAIIAFGEDWRPVGPGCHFAFQAPSRMAVAGFHAAALAHGGTDDGPPGVRAHYNPGYYAAFVIDPDGHRLEAVRHGLD